MENKKLEILVVEDREENRNAAQKYFDTRCDVCVDFATNYEEARAKAEDKVYAGAIIDIEIPKEQGGEIWEWGLGLGAEFSITPRYKVPHVFLSEGYSPQGSPISRIFLEDETYFGDHNGKNTSDKTNPQAWKDAYETLMKSYPNIDEILEARRRVRHFEREFIGYPVTLQDIYLEKAREKVEELLWTARTSRSKMNLYMKKSVKN